MKDTIKITVIAAGFKEANKKERQAKAFVPAQDLESRPRNRRLPRRSSKRCPT